MGLEEFKVINRKKTTVQREQARSLESKIVECDKVGDAVKMWEQVKQEMIVSTRELCGSVRVEKTIQEIRKDKAEVRSN